jgi:hypothetical protein
MENYDRAYLGASIDHFIPLGGEFKHTPEYLGTCGEDRLCDAEDAVLHPENDGVVGKPKALNVVEICAHFSKGARVLASGVRLRGCRVMHQSHWRMPNLGPAEVHLQTFW